MSIFKSIFKNIPNATIAMIAGAALAACETGGNEPVFVDADIDTAIGVGNIGQYGNFVDVPAGTIRPLYIPRCTPPAGAAILDFDMDMVGYAPERSTYPEISSLYGVVSQPPHGTISPGNAVSKLVGVPEIIEFSAPQRHVGFYVGAPTGSVDRIDLVAFDAIGRVVGRDSIITIGQSVNTCMAVAASRSAGIARVEMRITGDDSVMFDRLYFSGTIELPELPRPVIGSAEFITPTDRATLDASRGHNVIGLIRIPVGMTLSEVTLSVPRWDGTATETHFADFFRLRTEGGDDVFWFSRARTLIREGASWIGVTAVGPGVRATSAIEVIGEGSPRLPAADLPGNIDIEPITMEVTQAIRGVVDLIPPGGSIAERSDNILVRDKPTIVRGFARYTFPDLAAGSAPDIWVLAELHGSRDGAALPGSPILAFGLPRSPVAFHTNRTRAYHRLKQRTAASWNFRLPGSWTTEGSINLRMVVNPSDRAAPISEYAGTGGALNSISLTGVNFRSQMQPSVRVWSVDYQWQCPYTGDFGLTTRNFGFLCTPGSTAIRRIQPTDLEIRRAVRSWWNMAPLPGIWPRTFGIFDYIHVDAGPPPPQPHLAAGSTIEQILVGSAFNCFLVTNHDYSRFNLLVSSFVRGCAYFIPSTFRATATDDGTNLMHESGHTMGLYHTGGSHGASDSMVRWPGDHAEISKELEQSSAFNVRAMQALPYHLPRLSWCRETQRHDVMGYAACHRHSRWPSNAVWHHIEDVIGSNLVRVDNRRDDQYYLGAPGDDRDGAVLVEGVISPDGMTLRNSFIRRGGRIGDGDLRIEILDADGRVIDKVRTGAMEPFDVEGSKIAAFSAPLLISDLARTLAIYRNGSEVYRSEITPAPRNLSLLAPKQWPADGKLSISWKTTDAAAKQYLLEVSRDGKEWYPLALTVKQQVEFDAGAVPFEGPGWKIRVQATNGVAVALSEAAQIDFPVRDLRPFIINPLDGDVLTTGDPIRLTAALPEFAIADPSMLEWTYKGIVFATGLSGALYIGDPGQHSVQLRNPKTNYKTTVSFTVMSDTDYDGLSDDWELLHKLDPRDPSDSQLDQDADGLMAWEEFALATNPNSADTDQDGFPDGFERQAGSDPLQAKSIPDKKAQAELIQQFEQSNTTKRP